MSEVEDMTFHARREPDGDSCVKITLTLWNGNGCPVVASFTYPEALEMSNEEAVRFVEETAGSTLYYLAHASDTPEEAAREAERLLRGAGLTEEADSVARMAGL